MAGERGILPPVRDGIRAMRGYVPGEQRRDAIKLNTNESPWPASPRIGEHLRSFEVEDLRRYPDPVCGTLRRIAAEVHAVGEDRILVGNGSDDCLTICFRMALEPGDPVACPWPTYGLYDTLAAIQGAAIRHVPYHQRDDDWELDDALAETGAKLCLVSNPNNPSGTLVPPAQLVEIAERIDGFLVVDEAYVDFAPEGSSCLPLLDAHPNLIVLRTLSKSYALAGLRLGLMFAHPSVIEQAAKVKDSYNVGELAQEIAATALADRDHHRSLVERARAARADLERICAACGWSWPASAANFLLCRVGDRAAAIKEALAECGILIRHWETPELADRLRISIGTDAHQRALEDALAGIV